jgi:hypothetical protein
MKRRWDAILAMLTKPCTVCSRDFYHLVHWGLTEDIVAHTYRLIEDYRAAN